MILKNEKGAALLVSLFVVLVLLSISSMFLLRSVNENNLARMERDLTKAFYIGEAAAHAGLYNLDDFINTDLSTTIGQKNPQVVGNSASNYVASNDSLGFLIEYAEDGGTPIFTLASDGLSATHTSSTVTLATGTFDYDVIVMAKGNPITVSTDTWDFPYNYRVEGGGTSGNLNREVLISGDFTIRVQRDNFAKFALFTDHHGLPSGSSVWFTNRTNFEGPVHTNERFSFAFNPGGIFDGAISQHLTKARFYNNGSPVLIDHHFNGSADVPIFNSSFLRGEATIVLPSSVQKGDLQDQATGGTNIVGNGIFVSNDGVNLTGGIFIRGDSTIVLGVDGSGNATYNISEPTTGSMFIIVDQVNNTTSVDDGSVVNVYTGVPDGMDDVGTIIYVDGQVDSISGVVQQDTEITVSSEWDIIVGGDLKYQNYSAASGSPGNPGYSGPDAVGNTNLLGLLSWGGDVRIGSSAPNDVEIHGIVLGRNGIFTVDNYNDTGVGPRGTATLLGGVITQFYGAFGLFNGSTGSQLSGYGRNFVYDERTLMGKSPPYFPTLNTFVGFTNDLTDKLVWQEGGV
ncbi:MAG: DUF4900 domain-containing protein [Candidatus Omnitrophica bacterium]|nr:DUF4900 domain-containing protein [Candidatus Omnitrophota bacterium]